MVAEQFRTKNLQPGYEIRYYDNKNNNSEITNKKIKPGVIYVVIKASAQDDYWTDSTNFLQVTIINALVTTNIKGANWCLAKNSKGEIFAATQIFPNQSELYKQNKPGVFSKIVNKIECVISVLLIDKNDKIYIETQFNEWLLSSR